MNSACMIVEKKVDSNTGASAKRSNQAQGSQDIAPHAQIENTEQQPLHSSYQPEHEAREVRYYIGKNCKDHLADPP